MKFFWFVFILYFSISNVNGQKKNSQFLYKIENYKFPYNLQKSHAVHKLPDKLNEISGLSFYKKNELAVVQDEKGIIFIFNVKTGKITEKIEFSENGDYEGIEVIKNQIWVLKSNGNIYRVTYSKKGKNINTKLYKTNLSSKNDAEGLTYDKKNNRLLVACKGHPYIDDKKGKNKKTVYSFNLDEKELSKKPVFKIDLNWIKEIKKYNTMAKLGVDFLSYINPSKGDVSFQPSGIAIHPKTKNIYLLGSVGKLLIVCKNNGEVLAVNQLISSLFVQPEGICFDLEGNLFISNEGKESVATILKFRPK